MGHQRSSYRSRIAWNGFEFASHSEAVCGALLVKFLPNFKLIEGETFQVPLGDGKTADFKFGNIVVEYHHAQMRCTRRRTGDFRSKRSYLKFKRELRRLRNSYRRERFVEEVKNNLLADYYEKRRQALNESPQLRHTELIVVSSPKEVFSKILARFSRNPELTLDAVEDIASAIFDMLKSDSTDWELHEQLLQDRLATGTE